MSESSLLLGKKVSYITKYDNNLLFPISRKIKRDEICVPEPLPFYGYDIWNAFEVSWLNQKNKPQVAIAEIIYPAFSPYIIESKSLKLYLNSFNNSTFQEKAIIKNIITSDLSKVLETNVTVNFRDIDSCIKYTIPHGICLDNLDIECEITKNVMPCHLSTLNQKVNSETIHSNLLKSNCLVTNQPDWGTIEITYTGKRIDHASLLKYIVSFRNHNEFHEQCVERIFMDITNICKPKELTVYARYTRRGGIDINPFRTTIKDLIPENIRYVRQ